MYQLNNSTITLFKDIDECMERPCEINELCENKLGSFECHCKTGFQLDKVTHACTGNMQTINVL